MLKVKAKKLIMADVHNEEHCANIVKLINYYMMDGMGLGESMPEKLGVKIIHGLRNHPCYKGFFVIIENEYAALANCNINFSTWQAKPLINIHDLIVAPAYRNQGVGLFLLTEIEKYARENDYCRINLEVRHDNYKAQKLYQKAGFNACNPENYFWERQLL